MLLLRQGLRVSYFAHPAIGFKTRLQQRHPTVVGAPGVFEFHPTSILAEGLGENGVDHGDPWTHAFFEQHLPFQRMVVAMLQALGIFNIRAEVQPILTRFGELKNVLPLKLRQDIALLRLALGLFKPTAVCQRAVGL